MSFQIIGDSCCDYPYLAQDYDWLRRVPLTIDLAGESFVDDKALRSSLLLSKMSSSLSAPKSACPAPGLYLDECTCGADDIYIVTLSDKLSGSFQSAVMAADIFKRQEPEKNIFVFSSKSAASGEIAICEKIYALASAGVPFKEVVSETLAFISSLSTFFVLENLEVFRKNGRLNHLQSVVTSALRLKLVMGGDETGNICLRGKAMSIDKAICRMADLIAEKNADRDLSNSTLYITQCQCPDRARKAAAKIMDKTAFANCRILTAGGISTIYANSGGLVVAF